MTNGQIDGKWIDCLTGQIHAVIFSCYTLGPFRGHFQSMSFSLFLFFSFFSLFLFLSFFLFFSFPFFFIFCPFLFYYSLFLPFCSYSFFSVSFSVLSRHLVTPFIAPLVISFVTSVCYLTSHVIQSLHYVCSHLIYFVIQSINLLRHLVISPIAPLVT